MSHKRILFVEDDREVRVTLTQILVEEGYAVDGASNGREALDALRSGDRPCVILLDLMMPIMNGWQFSAAQRKDPSLAEIPVVIISAATNVLQSAAAMGAAAFLRKPFAIQDLLSIVDRCCGEPAQ